MTLELLGILLYVLVQLGIGYAVSRTVKTEEDYLLAGRRLGPVLAVGSVFATWFGAETCIGAAGAVYEDGLGGGTIEPFGYGLCLVLMGLVYAAPLHRRGLVTLADLFRERFGTGVERLVAVLVVPTSILWAGAQVKAFGAILAVSSGLDPSVTVTLAALIAIVYTAMGGLLADAITDVVQGTALVIGLLVLAGVVASQVGGPVEVLATEPAARLALGDAGWLATAEAWAIPICGSVLAQELVARVLGARSPALARGAGVAGGSLYILVGLLPVYLGLAGARLLPGLDDAEAVLPALARSHLGSVAFVLLSGALVSAILSTVDSALLATGAIVEHNLVVSVHPELGQAARLRVARVAVVVSGLLAWGLALSVDTVFALVEEASAFGSAGVFVVGTVALFSRWGGALAAVAGLLAGLAAWVVGAHVIAVETPYLLSLGASALAFVAGGVLERR